MRLKTLSFIAAALPLSAHAQDVRVAVDIAPVHSLVSLVMEGVGAPDLIVPQTASPHDHSMRPSEARALDQADVVFWIGPDLTPWLEKSVDTLAADALVVNVMTDPATKTMPFREGATFEAHDHHDHGAEHKDDHKDEHDDDHDHDDKHADGHDEDGHEDHADTHDESHDEAHNDETHNDEAHHDDDHHDAHGDGQDPHVWMDPDNAQNWVAVIAATLAEADPANKAVYLQNAANASSRFAQLDADVRARLAPIKGIPFVVSHDAYHYFEAHFDIEAVGAIAASDAQSPSPKRLVEIRNTIEQTQAKCVFTEPAENRDWISAVAPDVGVGELDPIGFDVPLGPDHYFETIRALSVSLAKCLSD